LTDYIILLRITRHSGVQQSI